MSTLSFANLPPLVIKKIWKYLPLRDIVACGRVNKWWLEVYNDLQVRRINLSEGCEMYYSLRAEADESADDDLISPSCYRQLFLQPQLANLRVFIIRCFAIEFDLNVVNRFRHLIHLEISANFGVYNLRTREKPRNIILNLPNLRRFIFTRTDWRTLIVNSEDIEFVQLTGCVMPGLTWITYPNRVTSLSTDGRIDYLVNEYSNVETLYIRYDFQVGESVFDYLPNLKQVYYEDFQPSPDEPDDLRASETLRAFRSDGRRLLANPDFQVFIRSVGGTYELSE